MRHRSTSTFFAPPLFPSPRSPVPRCPQASFVVCTTAALFLYTATADGWQCTGDLRPRGPRHPAAPRPIEPHHSFSVCGFHDCRSSLPDTHPLAILNAYPAQPHTIPPLLPQTLVSLHHEHKHLLQYSDGPGAPCHTPTSAPVKSYTASAATPPAGPSPSAATSAAPGVGFLPGPSLLHSPPWGFRNGRFPTLDSFSSLSYHRQCS